MSRISGLADKLGQFFPNDRPIRCTATHEKHQLLELIRRHIDPENQAADGTGGVGPGAAGLAQPVEPVVTLAKWLRRSGHLLVAGLRG
jgi:hypothetical protein